MVAKQMAAGARNNADSDVAISITGIAGPTADGTKKGIGTVFIGVAIGEKTFANSTELGGNRAENKAGFVHFAIQTALDCWDKIGDLDAYINKEKKNTLERELLKEKNILVRENKIKPKLRMMIGRETMIGKMKKPSLRKFKDAENSKGDDLADNVEW